MQVKAVSSFDKGFTGKRDRIDAAIVQDDRSIRELAYLQSMEKVKDNKHKKISNALWYSIPLVAGLSTAILSKGNTSVFGKQLSGLAGKTADGLASALGWGVTLGVADLFVGANNLARKKSETVRKTEDKHPILTFVGLLAGGVAALAAAPYAIGKVLSKVGPKTTAKLANAAGKAGDAINKIKTPKFLQNIGEKISKHTPSVIKNATANVINLLPEGLLVASLFHSINHSYDRNREFNKNYSKMKDVQLNLAQARVRELKVENDFLKQFPENVENLKLTKKPLKDLPEEVTEKVAEVRAEREAEAASQEV